MAFLTRKGKDAFSQPGVGSLTRRTAAEGCLLRPAQSSPSVARGSLRVLAPWRGAYQMFLSKYHIWQASGSCVKVDRYDKGELTKLRWHLPPVQASHSSLV